MAVVLDVEADEPHTAAAKQANQAVRGVLDSLGLKSPLLSGANYLEAAKKQFCLDSAQRGTCGIAVCFVIDESGSIAAADFTRALNFTRDVINKIANLSTKSQYGAAEFASSATAVAGLASMTNNTAAALAAINANNQSTGGTNTDAGLATCYASSTSGILTRNIDSTLPRMVMLLTDGNANVYDKATNPIVPGTNCQSCTNSSAIPDTACWCGASTCTCADVAAEGRAAKIRQDQITLVSIGVGSGIRSDWLDKISDYNFTASSFSALGAIIDTIVKAACTDVDVGVGCSANGVAVGGNGTVQLTLDNPSPYDVTGAIPMNITLPTAGLSLVGVTATAGAPPITCGSGVTSGANTVYVCTVTTSTTTPLRSNATLVYTITTRALALGNWTTTVVVKPPADNDATNNQAFCTTRVTAPDVIVSKSPANVSVAIGSNASYSITVSNVGGAAASSVVVTETLPAGLVYVSGPAVFNNGSATNSNPSNTTCCTALFPDVTVSKSPANVSVAIGSNASYSITVSNVGGAAASSVVVTETLPAGLVYVSGPAVFNNGSATNSNPSNTTCCTALFPDVTVSKSPANVSVAIGSNASYSITVSNVGGAAASSVVVTETLPAGLVYVSGPAGEAQQAD
ncbi:hypothetical protein OEZ86_012534 [Tetradesmus obliquus]|nr:hypothetical protein OEZ86_012534 [Tetradesmus obliquus]